MLVAVIIFNGAFIYTTGYAGWLMRPKERGKGIHLAYPQLQNIPLGCYSKSFPANNSATRVQTKQMHSYMFHLQTF